jgi:hypothetical protein
MRVAAAVMTILALEAHAAEGDKTLALPRPLQAGEVAVIEVEVGTLARGQEIHITTASGRELGVISPFGVRSGQEAGIYPLPVPPDAIAGRHLNVHVTVIGNGAQPRAPTPQEVRRVKVIVGASATGTSRDEEKK